MAALVWLAVVCGVCALLTVQACRGGDVLGVAVAGALALYMAREWRRLQA